MAKDSQAINEMVDEFLQRNMDHIAVDLKYPQWTTRAVKFQNELRKPFQQWCREQQEKMVWLFDSPTQL